jgi:hypothetical protein
MRGIVSLRRIADDGEKDYYFGVVQYTITKFANFHCMTVMNFSQEGKVRQWKNF